jgi:hypothetical protein
LDQPQQDHQAYDQAESRKCVDDLLQGGQPKPVVRPAITSRPWLAISGDRGRGELGQIETPGHPIERIAPDFCLDLLIGQGSGLKSPANDGLVAKHRGLN